MNKFYLAIMFLCGLLISGCSTTLSPDVVPVTNFEAEKYLGKWYEIARIDSRFEKGLSKVTAEYTRRDDGGIKVVNRGYKAKDGKWKDAVGKAYFVDGADTGHLKVSFFGPIYGPYVVFDLDENYQYSFVTNHNKKYLWLLARNPQIPQSIKDRFEQKVKDMSFRTDKLIWVDQSPIDP